MQEKNKPDLVEEIRAFRKSKFILAIGLILIGLPGLILPIIPGLLSIALGLWLLMPRLADRFSNFFKKHVQNPPQ